MKSTLLGLFLAAMSTLFSSVQAQFLYVNLSYKVVLNPADGTRPGNITDAAIDRAITRMNQLQAAYFRGIRFRRVDPVIEIGGMGDTSGPSKWYDSNFFDKDNGQKWENEMESAAKADSAYQWNAVAVNLYVTRGICGGICSLPGHDIIILGGCSFSQDGAVQMHEIGHHFNLCHTQGCPCGTCGTGSGQCNSPDDDGISDTLPDVECWNQNQIAMANFGNRLFDQLSAFDQGRVNDVFFNIMSYHNKTSTGQGVSRLTEKQLDRWTDAANGARYGVMTGRTWFVDRQNQCSWPAGGSSCTALDFGGPFRAVGDAVGPAANGDILLIRPGAYNERLAIRKPLTLRASRAGAVTIGSSVMASPAPAAAAPFIAAAAPFNAAAAADVVEFPAVEDGEPGRLGFAGSATE